MGGRILPVLLVLAGLYGCGGMYGLVEFEVLEPATIHFPDRVEQLMVLNRAPVTFDAFSEEDRQGMNMQHVRILDTAITNSITKGLLEVLEQSPIQQFRDPILLSDRRSDTTNLEDMILTRPEVESLCRRNGADAIISLELYTMDLDEYLDRFADSPGILTHYYMVSNRVSWYIYLPGNPRPFDRYVTIDTLYFPGVVDGVSQYTPPVLDMMRELFFESGIKYGKYLVPMWMRTSRVIYKGKDDSLRQAGRLTTNGQWDEAFRIWMTLSGSGDSSVAAKAYHNLAVYYELEDKLDSASFMIDRSLELDSLQVTVDYREEMDVRLLNRKEVIEQVN